MKRQTIAGLTFAGLLVSLAIAATYPFFDKLHWVGLGRVRQTLPDPSNSHFNWRSVAVPYT